MAHILDKAFADRKSAIRERRKALAKSIHSLRAEQRTLDREMAMIVRTERDLSMLARTCPWARNPRKKAAPGERRPWTAGEEARLSVEVGPEATRVLARDLDRSVTAIVMRRRIVRKRTPDAAVVEEPPAPAPPKPIPQQATVISDGSPLRQLSAEELMRGKPFS